MNRCIKKVLIITIKGQSLKGKNSNYARLSAVARDIFRSGKLSLSVYFVVKIALAHFVFDMRV